MSAHTPRTDAALERATIMNQYGGIVEIARQLERENTELLEALQELIDVDDDYYLQCREGGSLVSALTSARNAIAKALGK